MLFLRAFRTVARKSEYIVCDPIAVLVTMARRVARALGHWSVPALFVYQPESGRATSLALPRGPQLMKALLRWTGKRPLAGPILQWTHRRYKRRQCRANPTRQQVNPGMRHDPGKHPERQSF